MKKKIVSALLVTLSTMMLFGCGTKGTVTTENGETVNVEISKKKAAKADTVSEFFSKGKHWACCARNNSKGAYLLEIYFFDDGKVTVFPGDAYGCTLGDLAQMSDKEIWNRYEEVRETYKTTYLESKQQLILSGKSPAEFQQTIEALNQLNRTKINDIYMNDELATSYGNCSEMVESILGYRLDDYIYAWMEREQRDYDIIDFTEIINELNDRLNSDITFEGPFYDLPVVFAIETDGTGNATEHEYIYYNKFEEYYNNGNYVSDVRRGTVNHFDVNRGGVGGEIQIYDKNIFYYAITDGNYFCTTEYLQLDNPKSKNCLVDRKQEEITTILNDMK